MYKEGNIFYLKKIIPVVKNNKQIYFDKGSKIVSVRYYIDSVGFVTYEKWLKVKGRMGSSFFLNFSLNISGIENVIESQYERRKRIIKEIIK